MLRCGGTRHSQTISAGLTLIEVLVSIAILGLLLATLIPAVQSAREAARRTKCASHLRQIGIATQNYETTYRLFPGRDYFQQLLPFLEQENLLPEIDVRPADARAELYACPSDVFAAGYVIRFPASYMPSEGVMGDDGFIFSAHAPPWQVRAGEITDGLSATAAFSERLVLPQPQDLYNPPPSFPDHWNRHPRQTAVHLTDLDAYAAECMQTQLPPTFSWDFRFAYNHIVTPNRNSCYNGPNDDLPRATTASSSHPGGVHLLLGDGSLRFMGDSIDPAVWRAIGTRAGNDIVAF